jgi:hypothetical protein
MELGDILDENDEETLAPKIKKQQKAVGSFMSSIFKVSTALHIFLSLS